MEKETSAYPILVLMFLPVYTAIGSLILEFNYVDFGYLVLVAFIFVKYFIQTRKRK